MNQDPNIEKDIFAEALELSPVEYAILIIVRDNKTVTQSELAAVLKMHLPNLVKILSRMEEAGIMRRKRSARDKRAVELSLSASGQRRADEASRLGEIFNAKTLAPLSKPEQAAFVQMLGAGAAVGLAGNIGRSSGQRVARITARRELRASSAAGMPGLPR